MEKQSFIETHKKRLTASFNASFDQPQDYESELMEKLNQQLTTQPNTSGFIRPFMWAAAGVALLLGTLTLTSIRPFTEHETTVAEVQTESSTLLAADDLFDYHVFEILDSFEPYTEEQALEEDIYWYDYTIDELIDINSNS